MTPDRFAREFDRQLTYLVAFARAMNELDLAGAVIGEFRGMQDAGWSTSITAYEVHGEIEALGRRDAPLGKPEYRHMLALYAQLAEAGGVYEGLLNLMSVIELKPYSMWPFQDLVRVRREPHRIIGPNANAMFRRLAGAAEAIGMTRLGGLLEIAFRDDIRNSIAHADYIIADNGLRLRRRNGGNAFIVSHGEVEAALNIALFFFSLWDQAQANVRASFRPARRIVGRFSANPPMAWTVEQSEQGGFSIRSDAPGCEVDGAYERQRRINDRLGGRVFALYTQISNEAVEALLDGIHREGFEPLHVVLAPEAARALSAEIDNHELWVAGDVQVEGELLATPFGFRRIAGVADFLAGLPDVEPLELI